MLGTIIIVLLAIGVGLFIHSNPLLFGRTLPLGDEVSSLHVYTEHPMLDLHLETFRNQLGDDFIPYRNHCLRVLTFSAYQLGQEVLPRMHDINLMAVALAYHDIALWTDNALDYLEPSIRQLRKHVNEVTADFPLSENDVVTAEEIIRQHHKLTEWKSDDDAKRTLLVNAVRQGDWADATMGVVRFDLPADHLQLAYDKIPEAGFHNILAGFGARVSPDSFAKRLDVLKILKW